MEIRDLADLLEMVVGRIRTLDPQFSRLRVVRGGPGTGDKRAVRVRGLPVATSARSERARGSELETSAQVLAGWITWRRLIILALVGLIVTVILLSELCSGQQRFQR